MTGSIRGATAGSIANRAERRERYEAFHTFVLISRRGVSLPGRRGGTRGGMANLREAANVESL